jgi:acetoacetyl-[acyl-carrier protein] synthase
MKSLPLGVDILSYLPVIVGFGGVSGAGRSSCHHAYRRLVIDQLASKDAAPTYHNLATMMGLVTQQQGQLRSTTGDSLTEAALVAQLATTIEQHTLVRQLEKHDFDPDAIAVNCQVGLLAEANQPLTFSVQAKQLPKQVPPHWQLTPQPDGLVKIKINQPLSVLLADQHKLSVQSASQLPKGFNPGAGYNSRHHPRGLQMAVYAASDALGCLGIPWQQVCQRLAPDQIAVYAASAMGQLDQQGNGGMLQAMALGKRISAKQLPLGFAEMPADFINAYILGSSGHTGGNLGACATFLYNLQSAVRDIQSGRCRAAVVGASEAPVTPEIIEAYRTMGALGEDHQLLALDSGRTEPDYRRACRPFAENIGFTIAESAQFVILFADDLAMELGAPVYGAVADVFVNADGFKKSIASPGVGNYFCLAKAMASVKAILGEHALAQRSYVQAHGTGTPYNRVTESHILNELAKTFGIRHWPVTAIKAYLGHSIGAAAGDQLMASLGTWQYGIIPAIHSIDKVAEDVYQSHLGFAIDHLMMEPTAMDTVLINAKGFGGNNSSAAILAPHIVTQMLTKKYGQKLLKNYYRAHEPVAEQQRIYDQKTINNDLQPVYQFGEHIIDAEDLVIEPQQIKVPGYGQSIRLTMTNPYPDMC